MTPPEAARSVTEYCVVLTTCASQEQADRLCGLLLDRQLAACIQVMEITSTYVWQGARQTEPERLLLVKTRRDLYEAVQAALLASHPYDTPEIICLPVLAGAPAYLGWIDAVTAHPPSGEPSTQWPPPSAAAEG